MNAPSVVRVSGFQGTTQSIQHEPTSPIGRLIAAAREPLPSILDARNDAIRYSAQSLRTTLEGLERSNSRVAGYLLDEVRVTVTRAIAASGNTSNSAREDHADATRSLGWLGQIPTLVDGEMVERARDQEIRLNARSMSAKERADLRADMRKGSQERVMLALARSPLPDELEKEASELFKTIANSAKRQALHDAIGTANDTISQADTLRRVAVATMAVLDAFSGVRGLRAGGIALEATS